MNRADLPRFYFDLKPLLDGVEEGSTPFTPAITLVLALRESVTMLLEEGMTRVWSRHARIASASRAAMTALGLPLFARNPANGVTAVGPLKSLPADSVVKRLRERHSIRIAGGQGTMKGSIFRIGHMGDFRDSDILEMVAALESTLALLGHEFTAGAGQAAARRVFSEAG
jgi:aspartate aminotransferase-like enzyme